MQASLSIANSWSLLTLPSIELVMPSNHLILCHPLLLPSIFASIRVFSNESALCISWPTYWSFSFSISPPNEYSGLISCGKMSLSPLTSSLPPTLRPSQFLQPSPLPGPTRPLPHPALCPIHLGPLLPFPTLSSKAWPKPHLPPPLESPPWLTILHSLFYGHV